MIIHLESKVPELPYQKEKKVAYCQLGGSVQAIDFCLFTITGCGDRGS